MNMLGETPLLLATRASADARSGWRLAVVAALLDHSACVNTSDGIQHETPLMEAASIGDVDLVVLLLQRRADPSHTSANGLRALDFAPSSVVKSVLEKPVDHSQPTGKPKQPVRKLPSAKAPPTPKMFTTKQSFPWPKAQRAAQRAAPPAPKPVLPPQPPTTEDERWQRLMERFPGFEGSGVVVPPGFELWTDPEQEMFVASLGEIWPAGRKARTRPALPASLRPHFVTLGLAEGTKDARALKRAYRQAALRWHPDKNRGSGTDTVLAAQKFQAASDAYSALCQAFGIRN